MKLLTIINAIFLFLILHQPLIAQKQNIYRIKSSENSLYLEVSNKKTNTDGVKVYLKKYSRSSKQKWIITKNYGDFYTIKNLANGKLMSILSYDMNRDGNSLILVSPNSSNLQRWKIDKTGSDKVLISNTQNNKVLVPHKNSYGYLNKIILNKSMSNRKQSWILIPVKEDNNLPNYNFSGNYKKVNSNLQMEIRNIGRNSYKAIFKGDCNDESLTGTINNNGVLVIPLRSNNNARLEIRKEGNLTNVSITNISQMSSRSYGKCNGGMIEGNYRKQQNFNTSGFNGIFQMSYSNQQMEIVKTGYDGYKVIFKGNCKAETLSGHINNRGILVIPLRGGYNDKLEIRKQGNRLVVSITNKNVMKQACNGGTIEGDYNRISSNNNVINKYYTGRYTMDYGNQKMEIIRKNGNEFIAYFKGNCNAQTIRGYFRNGVLEFPLQGGYNEKIIVSKQREKLNVEVTNTSLMRKWCKGSSLVGLYTKY